MLNGKKATLVKGVNKMLNGIIWKEFSHRGNYKWLHILPKIVKAYNERTRRTLRMKPDQVTTKAVGTHLL